MEPAFDPQDKAGDTSNAAPFLPQLTEDGSHTLASRAWGETYHSKFGAIQESRKVFIEEGLRTLPQSNISILEVGFGTGLNAFLAFLETQEREIVIHYTGIEKHPLARELWQTLNYPDILGHPAAFAAIHQCLWEREQEISGRFLLTKRKVDLCDWQPQEEFDLVFFDAFSPGVQPELWTQEIFSKIGRSMKEGSMLTTYCSRGTVKEALRSAGFSVKRFAGPAGKKHCIRAIRL